MNYKTNKAILLLILVATGLLSARWLSTRLKEVDRLWYDRSPILPNEVVSKDSLAVKQKIFEPESKSVGVEDTRFLRSVGELGCDFGMLAKCVSLRRLRLYLRDALASAVLASKTESELPAYIYEMLAGLDRHIKAVDFYVGKWESRASQGSNGQDPRTGIVLSGGSHMPLVTEEGNLNFALDPATNRDPAFEVSEILSRPEFQAHRAKSEPFMFSQIGPSSGYTPSGNVDCQKDHRLQLIQIARERLSSYSSIIRNTPRIQGIPVTKELFSE